MPGSTSYAPLSDAEWPGDLEGMKEGFATQLNVYRVMAHHPALLAAWEDFRNHVVRDNVLDHAALEIVILRTGCRRGSSYEWAQHVIRGRKAGLSDARMAAAVLGAEKATCGEDEVLIRAVDALVDDNRLTAELQDALCARYGKAGVLDVIATVGMYTTLSYILNSFETPLDDDVAASLEREPFLIPKGD